MKNIEEILQGPLHEKAAADNFVQSDDFKKAFVLACRQIADILDCPAAAYPERDVLDCDGDKQEYSSKELSLCWQKYLLYKASQERVCRICGCTENNACVSNNDYDTCAWVEADLCSHCAE